jgi:hypothetical protein
MIGRSGTYNLFGYKYSFNQQEKSTEIEPGGSSITAEFWQYDSRTGRRWNVDPILKEFESPYATFNNNPILNTDPDGADSGPGKPNEGDAKETSETKYYGKAGAITNRITWIWHEGGLTKSGRTTKTEAGWYKTVDYVKLLSSTQAAGTLAKDLKLFNGAAGGFVNIDLGRKDLDKFVGEGLSENTAKFLIAAAGLRAKDENYNVSGHTYPTPFNVEDMLGVGLLLKNGLKALGSIAVRNSGRLVGFGSDLAITEGTANLIPKRGWFDVVVHGTEDGTSFVINGPINKQIISPNQLYNNMLASGYKQGTPIRLLSCYSGSIEGGAASQLAKLAKAPVVAPQSWMLISNGAGFLQQGKFIVGEGRWFQVFR